MRKTLVRLSLTTALLVLVSACGSDLAPITDCQATGDITPICLFTNPEDIEALPDGKSLLISQMGSMEGGEPGNLVLFDTTNNQVSTLFPLSETTNSNSNIQWGASDCPGKPGTEFSPHGTSLRQRHDGRWQLAVVNHGERETVELFELLNANGQYHLHWRGCVEPESGIFMNDVAILRDGGFIASHMFDKHAGTLFGLNRDMWKALLGSDTGYVFEWQPEGNDNPGYRIIEGSRGPFINGIEISADDSTVYANVYLGDEVRKIDRLSGKVLGSAAISQSDNLAWSEGGALLAASHTGDQLDQQACMKQHGTTCAFEFTIFRIDTDTMNAEAVFRHEGAPMGAATVARHLGDYLYMGSFTGDRIIKVPYSEAPETNKNK